ncbi:hypothetical protein [Rhizobium leguminosarum]|uniref:hypothetical protein n=1 Tax=Rhizobium leguminosarum TaxID=384 RepID=UPI00103D1B4B|nr:hypothetical protein [Rhizobium leguminosarum]TBY27422.1 hypothetical protein E0H55_27410 [Rhizobium leguminosarum bv. viciae]
MKRMKLQRAAHLEALSVTPRAEGIYRRIAEASRRLEIRSIDARRRATVVLYLRSVVECAAGGKVQSVKHFYRQLEFGALTNGFPGMIFSESTFRRHVKFQRRASGLGEGLTLEDVAAAEQWWREEDSTGSFWPLQRLMIKERRAGRAERFNLTRNSTSDTLEAGGL